MNLIINAESLQSPLTGIGLYTRHLIEEFRESGKVHRIRCFIHGRLLDASDCLALVDKATQGNQKRRDRRLSLIHKLVDRTAIPYQLYKIRNNQQFRQCVSRADDECIYHDPNYILKPFHGPSVITVHDLSVLHYPQFHPKARVQHLSKNLAGSLARADHVITDSDLVRREVIKHFELPEEKVRAIPLGVSESFKPDNRGQCESVLGRYGLNRNDYLLCVATHEPRKNIERLIVAYLALPDRVQRVLPLVLAGSRGWHSSDLAAKMRDQERTGTIVSLGYVPRADLPALYAGARAFAFPSLYEGFGLPVLEAMASGTPVVTSRDTSMAEFTGDAAVLVDPRDTASIRDGLLAVAEDEALRRRLSSEGVGRAERFTWHRCAEQHIEVYRSLVQRPRQRYAASRNQHDDA